MSFGWEWLENEFHSTAFPNSWGGFKRPHKGSGDHTSAAAILIMEVSDDT